MHLLRLAFCVVVNPRVVFQGLLEHARCSRTLLVEVLFVRGAQVLSQRLSLLEQVQSHFALGDRHATPLRRLIVSVNSALRLPEIGTCKVVLLVVLQNLGKPILFILDKLVAHPTRFEGLSKVNRSLVADL